MTLPSPHFMKNVAKPTIEKLHVQKIDHNQKIQFVAYCKYCSEGFKSDNDLYQHRRNHEKCPYEGCKFNASSKAIADHVQRVHLKTNTLVKIQDLTTPEQIEKWRQERRKRYPTASNVSLRQQAQEERMQRGEKLQEKQQRFGDSQQKNHIKNFDKRNQDKNNQQNRHKNRDRQYPNKRERPQNFNSNVENSEGSTKSCPPIDNLPEKKSENVPEKKSDSLPEKTSSSLHEKKSNNHPKKKFDNVKPDEQRIDQDSSDDEQRATPRFIGTSQMKDYHQVETIVKEHAALSILGMYGTDSECDEDGELRSSDDPEETAIPIDGVAESEIIDEKPVDEEQFLDEDNNDAPDVESVKRTEQILPPPDGKNCRKRKHETYNAKRANIVKPRTILDYGKLRSKPSVNPFLEKLLQHDIRHERNILLQCVNYVVRNNFFAIPTAQPDEASKETLTAIESQANVEMI